MAATFFTELDQMGKRFQEANATIRLIGDRIHAIQVRLDRAKKSKDRRLQYVLLMRMTILEGVSSIYKEYTHEMVEKITTLEEEEWQRLTRDADVLLQ